MRTTRIPVCQLIATALACGLALGAAPLFATDLAGKGQPSAADKGAVKREAAPGRKPVHDRNFQIFPLDGTSASGLAAGEKGDIKDLAREDEEDEEKDQNVRSFRINRATSVPPAVRWRALAGPGPSPVIPSGGVQVVQSFEGIDFNGSSCGCLPPDTGAAVGNNFVVETVNEQIRVFEKSSGGILLDESLASFFGAPSGGDPYVVYDELADRWYVSAFNTLNDGLFLAVSLDGNPLNGFLPTYELTGVGGFPDYQKLGFNRDAIFISYNDFGSGGGAAAIAAIDKAAVLSGSLVYYVSTPLFQFRAMPPAQMHGDTTGGVQWFVSTDGTDTGGNTIRVVKMENYLSSLPSFTYTSLPVTPYRQAILADQPGGTVAVFPNTTTTQVQYRNGHLVTAMASGLAADGFVYPKGLYYQIDVSSGTPTLLKEGLIDPGPGVAVQMPAVDEDISGNLGLTWMQSSSGEYLSMWVGEVDPGGNLVGSVAAPGGGFFYYSFRIGDYSTTVLDPADGKTFWSANEYIGSDGDIDIWRTRITSFTLGMGVSKASPANGEIVSAPPAAYILSFSLPFDPGSVNAAGVQVNGFPATTHRVVDDRTIVFSFARDPVRRQGLQHFDVAEGTVRSLSEGEPTRAYTSTFRYDALRLQVVSTAPADGSVATLPLASLVVTLNERYDRASVSISNLVTSAGGVQSFKLVNDKTIKYQLAGITTEGILYFVIPAGALTDVFGNPNLPFLGILTLDYGTEEFPVPVTTLKPAGGLMYETSFNGEIYPAGDTDAITILADVGQTLTAIVESKDPSLRPTVTLAKENGGKGVSATAPGAGQDAVIQTFPTQEPLWASAPPTRYKVTVGGARGSLGHYHVRLVLNAAAELEEYDGPGNDSLATAQSLENSFLPLGAEAPKPERGAVFGRTATGAQPGDVLASIRSYAFFGGNVVRYNSAGELAQTIVSPEFDRGVVSDVELGPGNVIYVALSTDFFSGNAVKGELLKFDLDGRFLGRISLPDDPANTGYLYPYGFDVAPDGTLWIPQLNSGNLVHVDSAGSLLASYWVGLQPQDASVSPGGQVLVSFFDFNTGVGKVLQLDPSTGNVTDFVPFAGYNPVGINGTADGGAWLGDFLDALKFDSAGQLARVVDEFGSLDAQEDPEGSLWIAAYFNGVSKFSAAGDFLFRRLPANGDVLGLAVAGIDSPDPLPPPRADFYSFRLVAGQTATVALALLGGSPVTAELQDAAGNTLAQGTASKSEDYVLHDFISRTTGAYYIRVVGNGEYSVLVTRNAAFDGGGNDSIATAQPLIAPNPGVRHWVLGYVSGGNLDYSGGFGSPDGLTANGNALFVDNVGRLTDGSFSEAGSFFASERVVVAAFSTTFTFRIVPGTLPMADGLTFTIQGNAPTELGPGGGGLGYGPDFPGSPARGIRNSVAVKFDIYDNAGEGVNSTGLFTDGRSPTVPEAGSPDMVVSLDGTGIDLGSQNPFRVDLVYDGAVLTAKITDTVTLASASQAYAIDIPAQVGADTAFVGFTGGTGGLTAAQDILTWTYVSRHSAADFYRVELVGNKTVKIEVATPADGSGQFVNGLDPMIWLYDSRGNLVASSDNNASDHHKTKFEFKIPKGAGGTYYIAIAPSNVSPRPTRGDYIMTQSQ